MAEEKLNVYQKLMRVQNEIKSPKSNFNSFAKFNYRSLEDITEAAKPLLLKYGATIVLNDSVEVVGERYYMKCTAVFTDCETGESVSNTAYARESVEKRGMDESQVSGMASSYCRKYALNGLLMLDDTKDADSDEATKITESKKAQQKKNPDAFPETPSMITDKEKAILREMCAKAGKEVDKVFPRGLDLDSKQYLQAVQTLQGWIQKAEEGKK